jgi:hypothetical protein
MLTKHERGIHVRIALALVLITGLFGVIPVRASTGVHYVKWNASGADNGTSWGNAYVSLQSALSAAAAGDEIWVAAGTYKPTTLADRDATFVLKDGVAVYGGFTGTETLRTQRDAESNVTVLSGDLNGNDNSNISHDELTRADNVFHVVSSGDDGSATVLDGFTISGGNANLGAYGDHTTRGGGMWSGYGSPMLTNLVFTNNSAGDAGGGIFITNSNPTLTDITFTNNSAGGGGGLVNYQSNSILTNVIFSDNKADYMGGGAVNASGSQPVFTDVTFIGNRSNDRGGGMGNVDSNATIWNSTFYWNDAPKGGALYNLYSHPTLTNTTFFNNFAGSREGAAIANENSSPILTHLTIMSSNIYNGYDAIKNVSSHPVIRNSIIWSEVYASVDDIISIDDDPDSSSLVSDSVIQNGYPGGTSLIVTNPLLGTLGNYGGNTQTMLLFAGSPAIDQANALHCPATDQRGIARPQGMGCDIGSYEFQPTSTVRYVKWNAAGANNGTSWANAFPDLQSALSAASNGDEIWVAAGTYKPTLTSNRSISFTLKNGVAMYGGFAGTETSSSQRDYENNFTILSGDIGVLNDDSDNSYHVVVGSNTNNSAILDGFTVTAGHAFSNGEGGGMYNETGSPSVRNVLFKDNFATFGGGMYNVGTSGYVAIGSHPVLTNVVFENNSAIGGGGGMRNENYSDPILTNVIFRNNSVVRTGGGMENFYYSSPILTNVTFLENAASAGGGMFNWVGNHPILIDVTFDSNTANEWGGGMANYQSSPTLTNVTLRGNSATTFGGGISNEWNSNPTLMNVSFIGNAAVSETDETAAGGMYNSSSSPSLIGVTFENNSADYGGGVLNNANSSPNLVNVTFSNNSANVGGAIFNRDAGSSLVLSYVTLSNNSATIDGGAIANTGHLAIRNSILWGNAGGEIFNIDTGDAVVSNSTIQGGYSGTGNIDEDPLLGPLQDNGGFTQTMALGAGSPAIDAGNDASCPGPEVDQRGVTRPQGSHCDMGAYEYQAPVVTFSDVDTDYWAWSFVERLYAAGITSGCAVSPPAYCPEGTVTRAQMAVFLLRGMHGASYVPPAVGGSTGFVDVRTDHWAAAWIKQFAIDGVTAGCGANTFCPEGPVTRAQMAVFLLKAKYGTGYTPAAVGTSTGFTDVDNLYWAAVWIKQLAAEGITGGCGVNLYCPEAPVNRAQMAVFLVKTFNLP